MFHIPKTNIVIKFPSLEENSTVSRSHSRREIRRIKQVLRLRRYRHFRRYVPKIFYVDYQNGVLMMELLYEVGKASRPVEKIIDQMLADSFPCLGHRADATGDNLGVNVRGQIKVLDWGCV